MVTNYWASNRSEVYGSQSKGTSIRSENIYGANNRSEQEGAAACKKSFSHGKKGRNVANQRPPFWYGLKSTNPAI